MQTALRTIRPKSRRSEPNEPLDPQTVHRKFVIELAAYINIRHFDTNRDLPTIVNWITGGKSENLESTALLAESYEHAAADPNMQTYMVFAGETPTLLAEIHKVPAVLFKHKLLTPFAYTIQVRFSEHVDSASLTHALWPLLEYMFLFPEVKEIIFVAATTDLLQEPLALSAGFIDFEVEEDQYEDTGKMRKRQYPKKYFIATHTLIKGQQNRATMR